MKTFRPYVTFPEEHVTNLVTQKISTYPYGLRAIDDVGLWGG